MPKRAYKKFFDVNEIVKDISAYLEGFDQERFLKAYDFAEEAHRGQMRKDGKTPYLVHVVETVKILISLQADEDVLISGMLHDVPEDTKYTIEDVEERFGKTVAFLVDGITKLSKVHYKNNMPRRQVLSLKKLFLHSAKDLRIIIIKLSDRLHNMRTLEHVAPEKRVRISHETLEIYVPIANWLGIFVLKEELEDLCFKYLFPSEFKKLEKKVTEVEKKGEEYIKEFIKDLEKNCKKESLKPKIFHKRKQLYRLYKKISAHGKSIENLADRVEIKVIVNNEIDCYKALGVLHHFFVPTPDRFKDYISNPKVNGYKALHTVVFGSKGLMMEVQIQSKKMHLEGKYGIASAFFQKNQEKVSEVWTGDERAYWVNRILDIDKSKSTNDDFLENVKEDVLQDRIIAFTPKGKTVDLPKGATAIDFAYTIHSEVGAKAVKAEINGKNKPLITVLNTGDLVKIVTDKNASPKLSWLSFVKTHTARNKIIHHFRKTTTKKKIREGKSLLQKEMDIAGLGLAERIRVKSLSAKIGDRMGRKLQHITDLFIAVGEGRVKATEVVKVLQGKSARKDDSDYISVNIKVRGNNRKGLFGDILAVLYRYVMDINFTRAGSSMRNNSAFFKIIVLVDSLDKVGQIFEELEQIESVTHVQRFLDRGVIGFYLLSLLTAILWFIHPFILRLILLSGISDMSLLLMDVVIFVGLFSLMLMLIYLKRAVRVYFPLLRTKKQLWFISFVLITMGIVTILSELIYFNVGFGWIIALLIALIMYSYWLIGYREFKKSIGQS